MERSDQAKGWRGTRFNIGRFDPKNLDYIDVPEVMDQKDNCCTHESCGNGCYMTVVDFDRLDQQ